MPRMLWLGVAAAAVLAAASPAAAHTAKTTITIFSATNFQPLIPNDPPFPIPLGTFTGSWTAIYDDAATIVDGTRITGTSNLPGAGDPVLDYQPGQVPEIQIMSTTGSLFYKVEAALGPYSHGAIGVGLGANDPASLYGGGAISASIGTLAVPEPASWAMMLMGFGALGAVLRQRRVRLA